MKLFKKSMKMGDYVRLIGNREVAKVIEIDEKRKWLRLEGYEGVFERAANFKPSRTQE